MLCRCFSCVIRVVVVVADVGVAGGVVVGVVDGGDERNK